MSIALTGPQKDQTQLPHLEWEGSLQELGGFLPQEAALGESDQLPRQQGVFPHKPVDAGSDGR